MKAAIGLCVLAAGFLTGSVAAAQDAPLTSGLELSGFDPTVRIQDDLYQAVNGRWLARTEIPADKSNYGSFTALADAARENIRAIVEAASDQPDDETSRKVGQFYQSFMDAERIEALGSAPIQPLLKTAGTADTTDAVFRMFGRLQRLGVSVPIGFYVSQDAKDSTRYLAAVIQSGTTLPDRDYYLEDDEKYQAAREALTAYVAEVIRLAGVEISEETAAAVVETERRLAEVQWSRTELRNAEKRYNKMTVAELSELTPSLNWPSFFEEAGVPELDQLNVATPDFFVGLQDVLKETSPTVWKAYLQFHVIDAAAPYLSEQFAAAHFRLHQKELAGIPEQQPRWQRAVGATAGAGAGDFGVLGEAVGRLYVREHFPPSAKERMDEVVQNLLATYETSIRELPWMTEATRQRALEKLDRITPKIGYPSKWRDYSSLRIDAADLFGNMQRSAEFEYQRMIDRLGQPVDREEWGMTPQTVNAYYNPGKNEIVFPAAILQPPFFNEKAEDAVNYGGIGAVIGHEISHGFDDQGSKYDGAGNLKNWWTEDDRAAFEKLADALVEQYSSYEALPGRTLNGRLTLGENIADLSGMAIAYKAYLRSLGDRPAPKMDGYTGPQRFFLGWAQVWRRKYREQELVRRLVIDPHSPSSFRSNGPVINLDAFYDAFDVVEGDRMFRAKADRIQIW